jgi:23S rRNA (adenine2030-N6)-methyltransferase
MNYRHAFHAGNFADVVKHATLALLIERLKAKDAAFRVIDTHAGPGLYDLTGGEAARTGEWHNGIGRIVGRKFSPPMDALMAPYLAAVAAANDEKKALSRYPGSPWLIRHLLRKQDRLTAVELHPDDAAALGSLFAGDWQVKAIELDGWLALGSFVPPKERRGLVLADPPYESPDEFGQMIEAFAKAYKRWPTGIYMLWYPVKDLEAVQQLRDRLVATGIRRLLRTELNVRARNTPNRFNGSGLVICNAPWRFAEAFRDLLGGLAPILADGTGGGVVMDEIAGE